MGALIDLVGKRYGRLLVLEQAQKLNGNSNIRWKCRCDCGTETVVFGQSLRDGMTKSCGCYKQDVSKSRVKDEVDHVYGRLTVIRQVSAPDGKNRAYWLCKCECGNEKLVCGYDLRSRRVQSCGCLLNEPTNQLPSGEAAFHRMYYQYQQSAERRGLKFELSQQEFGDMTKESCHYCGQEPNGIWKSYRNSGDYICNGIDRMDNDVGYTTGNCVPCCSQCNYFKRDMEYQEFIDYLDRVALFRRISQ